MLIPDGKFLMGSSDDAIEANPDERPEHRVRITRPFYLGIYEVTQAQYKAVTGRNPGHFSATGGGADRVGGQLTPDFPVENVSWFDAIGFCNKLSEKERKKPFYKVDGADVRVPDWNGQGYRLPTEAEWEHACRAGTSTVFSFGNKRTQSQEYGWFAENSEQRTHRVGQKRPNPFGLYDVHGNVWEWCWDSHLNEYYAQSPTGNRSQSGITGIRQPRPLVDSLARGRGSLGHREPPRNRMSGSPAHSAPAGGRWLPPSASAPRTGSPPRYPFPR